MSPSNSSLPKADQKRKSLVVAVEVMKKIMNKPKQGSSQGVVLERTITDVVSERAITERPSFGLGVVRAESNTMKRDPPKEKTVYTCNICKIGFSSPDALGGHQNTHKREEELERLMKKDEPSYRSGQGFSMKPSSSSKGKSISVFGESSQDALSKDKHLLGMSPGSSKSIGCDLNSLFQSFDSGATGGIMNKGMATGHPVTPYRSFIGKISYGQPGHGFPLGLPLPNSNHNQYTLSNGHQLGHPCDPFMSREGGSNSDYTSLSNGGVTRAIPDLNMTMVPPATTRRSLAENTSYGSSSRYPFPSYNYSPHDPSLELSLGTPNPIGSSSNSNNNNNSYPSMFNGGVTRGIADMKMPMVPPATRYNYLELLNKVSVIPGSSESKGSSNNDMTSVDPSSNEGGTGGTSNLTTPLCPRVLRYRFNKYNPLDSITRNAPPSPPPRTTNPSNDENQNVSGSTFLEKLMAKGKNKIA